MRSVSSVLASPEPANPGQIERDLRGGLGGTTLFWLASGVEGRVVGRWSLKLLFVVLTCSACGTDESISDTDPSVIRDSTQTFAGPLEGTDAMVAAVRRGPDWLFYICGGPATQTTLTRWLQAKVESSSTVEATGGDATIVATPGSGSISGTLEDPAGAVYSFEADWIDAQPAEAAGLYATMDSGCRTGLVIAPSASDKPSRMQGVWCDSGGRVGQVVPIMPIELDQRGLAVLAGPDERLLHLLPAIPPL